MDILTMTEIRVWLKRHFTGGHNRDVKELPMKGFCRASGMDDSHLYPVRDGRRSLDPITRIRVSRFNLAWEAGMLEFGFSGPKNTFRYLIHRRTPRPRAMRLKVSWHNGPKLERIVLPAHNPRIISPKDIFAGLDKRRP